jgi:molybdate transport system substrate-binding protein
MRSALLAGTLAAALSLLVAPVAQADDTTITVLAGRAAQDLLNEMHPALEKATGHKIEMIWANATSVRKRMASGESYDVVIIVQPDIDLFIKHHQLAAGSRTDLMKTSVAVAVRAGAPHPDISSAEAVKRTLLAAKSIGYSSGTSGEYVVLMVEKLGIKDQVFSKMVQVGQGVRVAGLLAKREVELGLQQASELINEPGIDYLGPLPAELQKTSTYSAGIGAASKHPDAARALIKALMSPEAVEVMKKHGLEPG